uniref:NF-X1-type zinc finger protein NFXL1 n=1 Tax=Mesocestoides corti TaxID=53468 RepID=A0A5K3ENI2_MESCO
VGLSHVARRHHLSIKILPNCLVQVADGDAYGNRKVCTDPIPLCPNICGRPNPICGHPCPEKCHPGPSCPPCKLTAQITCRCGKSSKVISCSESAQSMLNKSSSAEFLCERICRKKKSCGRHKCNRKCCDVSRTLLLHHLICELV